MGSDLYFSPVFSGFTISVMEDVGYYKGTAHQGLAPVTPVPKYKMEEHMVWGNNKICDAFSGSCVIHPHRCKPNSLMCSPDYKSIGKCLGDPRVEGCFVFKPQLNQDCLYATNKDRLIAETDVNLQVKGSDNMKFGLMSRCVMGIISDDQFGQVTCQGVGCEAVPSCMRLQCNYNASDLLVSIHIDMPADSQDEAGTPITTMTCLRREINSYKVFKINRGGTLSTKTFIICPNFVEICDKQISCKDDCSLNGRCLKSGKCWCYYGWSGENCSIQVP